MSRTDQAHDDILERQAGVVLPFEPSLSRRRGHASARREARPRANGERRLLLAPPPSGPFSKQVGELFERSDVRLDGRRPWDVQAHSPAFYAHFLATGVPGLAESYADGWWDAARPDQTVHRLLISGRRRSLAMRVAAGAVDLWGTGGFAPRSHEGEIRSDLWRRILDRRMAHGSGFWEGQRNLDGAQESRLERICRRLALRPGMRLLDLGCGWGAAARFAAGLRGAQAVGLTPSESQAVVARDLCRGVPVDVLCQDWSHLRRERFDRALALGGLQALRRWSGRAFFSTVRGLLKDDGLLLVEALGVEPGRPGAELARAWPEASGRVERDWGRWPTSERICRSFSPFFSLHSWRDLGADYDRTLLAWVGNLDRCWPELGARWGERYCRLWRFALLARAAACRAGGLRLWELVLSAR